MLSERQSLIALSSVPGLTAKKIMELTSHFGSAQTLWYSRPTQWSALHLSDSLKNSFSKAQKSFCWTDFNARLQQHAINIITIQDDEYPATLLDLYDPPQVLYIRGQLKLNYAPTLAVVGSRMRTVYGESVITRLLPSLIQAGVTIISGMAAGIDADAHRCTLSAHGYTIAVLGNGIDYAYPRSNARLMQDIIANGAIISEYPPGFTPQKWTFPARNRIIAGLSKAVLVVEAGKKSGALITADFAMELGKDVFAIPGNIHSPMSMGTNALIQQGAKLVCSAEDILEELLDNNIKLENTSQIQLRLHSPQEQLIFDVLSYQPVHIDVIIKKTGLPVTHVLSALTMLSLQGIVKEYDGKLFSLNN